VRYLLFDQGLDEHTAVTKGIIFIIVTHPIQASLKETVKGLRYVVIA
jgi:hypothetical protein